MSFLILIASLVVGYLLAEAVLLVRDIKNGNYKQAHLRTARMALAAFVLIVVAGLGAVLTIKQILATLAEVLR